MLSVLPYRILSVKIVYSVQLNCIDSDYRDTDCYVQCLTAQHI